MELDRFRHCGEHEGSPVSLAFSKDLSISKIKIIGLLRTRSSIAIRNIDGDACSDLQCCMNRSTIAYLPNLFISISASCGYETLSLASSIVRT